MNLIHVKDNYSSTKTILTWQQQLISGLNYLTTHEGLGKDKIFVHTIVCDKVLNRIHVVGIDSSIEIPHHSWSWVNSVIITKTFGSWWCYGTQLLFATAISGSPFSSSSSFASKFWKSKRGLNWVQRRQACNDFDGGIWRRRNQWWNWVKKRPSGSGDGHFAETLHSNKQNNSLFFTLAPLFLLPISWY